MVSEDEEGCFEEYKRKGLVDKSAFFECPSLAHNSMSPAIFATVWSPIDKGTVVYIQSTKCDGVPECWNGIDEENCGFNTYLTLFIGDVIFDIIPIIFRFINEKRLVQRKSY